MKIRIAKRKDVEIIANQNIALAMESENKVLDPRTIREGVIALLSDISKGFYLVAAVDDSIVGQLMVTVEWSDWRNKPIWWVQSVYVQENWRKIGVLTHLLKYLQKKAEKQGVAFLRLYVHENNKSAMQAYEKIGWKQEPYLVYKLPVEVNE